MYEWVDNCVYYVCTRKKQKTKTRSFVSKFLKKKVRKNLE